MTEWQYYVLPIWDIKHKDIYQAKRGFEPLRDYLNRMGESGWELVDVLRPYERHHQGYHQGIFKRPVKRAWVKRFLKKFEGYTNRIKRLKQWRKHFVSVL